MATDAASLPPMAAFAKLDLMQSASQGALTQASRVYQCHTQVLCHVAYCTLSLTKLSMKGPKLPQEPCSHGPWILRKLVRGGFPPDVSEHGPAQGESQPAACALAACDQHRQRLLDQMPAWTCTPVESAPAGATFCEALAQAHWTWLSVCPLALPPNDTIAIAQRTPACQSLAHGPLDAGKLSAPQQHLEQAPTSECHSHGSTGRRARS